VISGQRPHHIARAGLGFVPEDRQVFPEHTVEDNLVIGRKKGPDGQDEWPIKRIYDVFPLLEPLRHRIAGRLSGGEQQMLAIGRGLMAEPRLLILDEPSLGLSPLLVEELFALIKTINAEGIAVLLVEQNVVQSLEVAQRAYILDNGRFVLKGSAAQIANDPDLKCTYLGM
jgi:branched-chain amino acid transport system ATP-binding protein